MNKEEVERIFGHGVSEDVFISYDSGLGVTYNDSDNVAFIRLDERSSGIYTTLQGVGVGQS